MRRRPSLIPRSAIFTLEFCDTRRVSGRPGEELFRSLRSSLRASIHNRSLMDRSCLSGEGTGTTIICSLTTIEEKLDELEKHDDDEHQNANHHHYEQMKCYSCPGNSAAQGKRIDFSGGRTRPPSRESPAFASPSTQNPRNLSPLSHRLIDNSDKWTSMKRAVPR